MFTPESFTSHLVDVGLVPLDQHAGRHLPLSKASTADDARRVVASHSSLGETAMAIRIVQLGSKRAPGEGLRIGTVRRPPRGVPRAEFAKRDFYDVWLPMLAPSAPLVKSALNAETDKEWNTFVKRYRAEMSKPDASALLNVLAALSHTANFAVGCYCEDESRCHRSILRQLLRERDAQVSG
jgi:uncharacterized protein YeaO (DUF488 family)